MKYSIKDLKRIEREIDRGLSGQNPFLVMDTGGLIDIELKIRQHNLYCNAKGKAFDCSTCPEFLTRALKNGRMIITPQTYREIWTHSSTKLNGHVFEISRPTLGYAVDVMIDSDKFVRNLEKKVSTDQSRYDSYWAAREGCREDPKKYSEPCSETDQEIIETIALLSDVETRRTVPKMTGPIVVVSSDAHVIKGASFLNSEFEDKYVGIVPISTRYRR